MSVDAIKQCWGESFPDDMDGMSKTIVVAVSLAIADIVNDTYGYEFYGATQTIADKARVSRTTVTRVIAHLVSAGVMTVIAERKGRTTRYRWHLQPDKTVIGLPTETCTESCQDPTKLSSTPDKTVVTIPIEPVCNPKDSTSPGAPGAPGGDPRVLEAGCPTCKEPAGSPCVKTLGNHHRTQLGHHSKRVARVVVSDWYSHVREVTGYPPTSPSWPALTDIVQRLITSGRSPKSILAALVALEANGRPLNGGTIRAQMDGRTYGRPPSHDTLMADLAASRLDADGNFRPRSG